MARLILNVKLEEFPNDLTATEIDILGAILEDERGELPTGEISKLTGKLYARVSSDLNSLKRKGILTSRTVGRKEYYSVKTDYMPLAVSIYISRFIMEQVDEKIKEIRSDPTLTPNQRKVAEGLFMETLEKELPKEVARVLQARALALARRS